MYTMERCRNCIPRMHTRHSGQWRNFSGQRCCQIAEDCWYCRARPATKECAMPKGTIKRLVRDRGFGFIRDDGGQEWFFHRSGVQGSFDQLAEGQRVAFDEESSPKGPRAGNVRSEG